MPSLHETAQLISGASSLRGAVRLVRAIGFQPPLRFDRQTLGSLTIDELVARAWVAEGQGTLRCCLVAPRRGQPVRTIAGRCAVRLADRAPHALWLVVVASPADHLLAVAVPPAPGTSRVVALVADTRRVQDSDAETLAAMGDAMAAGDVLTHHRWRELLGRDALTRRFYRALEAAVTNLADTAAGRAPADARREMALTCASRLIFLAFLEAKGWLDGDREFLRHRYDERCAAGGGVHRRLLEPLFFGTLNTPVERRAAAARRFGRVPFLNGGLFSRTPVERRWHATAFSDDGVGRLVCDLLGHYRVTAREESTSWSEAAVDPEMLGRAFESLMAGDERRSSGAFYTPVPILERVTTAGLDEWFATQGLPEDTRRAINAREPIAPADRARVLALVSDIRVLDPACGSGAFLVHAMERLADIRGLAGDRRPAPTRRRDVLSRSIFGVDINPMAVWLCELRLWLSVVIDAADRDGMGFAPLPNLDHHVRVGDALAGPAFEDAHAIREAPQLATLRRRYAQASGARKRTLARALDNGERRIAIADLTHELTVASARRRDLIVAARGRDLFAQRAGVTAVGRAELAAARQSARSARQRLARLRAGGALPFSFRVQFADVAARGGFDIVLGNPPWVRLHRIGAAARTDLAARYRSWREAAWLDGARDASAGRGFASQVDLAALFAERAVQVARPGAALSLLLPAKLWLSLSAGGIRRVVTERCRIVAIEDWSESPAAFDAVVYPSMLVASREAGSRDDRATVRQLVHRRDDALEWDTVAAAMPLDQSAGAPWILVPPGARDGFDLLVSHGVPFSRSVFSRPVLGVKTGCNDAFVVTPEAGWHDGRRGHSRAIRHGDREGRIEHELLRPVLRGEGIGPWTRAASRDAIVWTHGVTGAPLDRLPPLAAAWLAPWRARLSRRTDASRAPRHWMLFRTDAADSNRARVVWSDISRKPRATVLAPGDPTVPLNSCYVAFAPAPDDAFALATLLNSAPVAAWLCALAEPARGGYRRFLGWTIARFPLPMDWPRTVALLAPIGRAAADGTPPDPHVLTDVVARAYGLRTAQLAPLVAWCLR